MARCSHFAHVSKSLARCLFPKRSENGTPERKFSEISLDLSKFRSTYRKFRMSPKQKFDKISNFAIITFAQYCRSKVSTCIVEYVGQYCESKSVCCLSVDVIDESFVGCEKL